MPHDRNRVTRIHELQSKILQIIPNTADPSEGFALLDFPDYGNVGDSLIWLGAVELFRHLNLRPDYVSTKEGFDPEELIRFCPQGPIYLSGGGNFGDLWPKFQSFREAVLDAFPDRRVVQLPQSIHFQDAANLRRTRDKIHQHGDFALLVRDQRSLGIARHQLDWPAQLCPDLAFMLGDLSHEAAAADRPVFLMRADKESKGGGSLRHLPDQAAVDWLQDTTSIRTYARLIMPAAARLSEWRGNQLIFQTALERLAKLRRARGINMLKSADVVATDRLHAHVLALLLGKPNIVVDNSYGKISGFIECWTADDPLVRCVESFDMIDGALLAEMSRRNSAAEMRGRP